MKVELLSITNNAEELIEKSARICYNSKINKEKRKEFLQSLIKKGHLSILEHATATFKISEVSRTLSHQLVRHRLASYCIAGDTKILRFNQNRKHLTIKELYERSLDSQLNGRNKLMKLRSMNENNIIVPNNLKF